MKTLQKFLSEQSMASVLIKLTRPEREIIANVINHLSDGGHPVAEWNNLKFFQPAYVKELLEKAVDMVHEDHVNAIKAIISKF